MFLPPKSTCIHAYMHNSMFSMYNVSQAILIADVFMQLLGTILRMCKRSCVQLLVWFVLCQCVTTIMFVQTLTVQCAAIWSHEYLCRTKKVHTLVEVCEKSVTTLSSIFISIATCTCIEHCSFCSSVPLKTHVLWSLFQYNTLGTCFETD